MSPRDSFSSALIVALLAKLSVKILAVVLSLSKYKCCHCFFGYAPFENLVGIDTVQARGVIHGRAGFHCLLNNGYFSPQCTAATPLRS